MKNLILGTEPRQKPVTITITYSLLEKVGKRRATKSGTAAFRWGNKRVEVAYRPHADHYTFFNLSGQWLGGIDHNAPIQPKFDNQQLRAGYRFKLPA